MSFTIKCNECGKEQVVRALDFKSQENAPIYIGVYGNEIDLAEAIIECECGNHC